MTVSSLSGELLTISRFHIHHKFFSAENVIKTYKNFKKKLLWDKTLLNVVKFRVFNK